MNSPIAIDHARTSVLRQESELRSSQIPSSEKIKPFANGRFDGEAVITTLEVLKIAGSGTGTSPMRSVTSSTSEHGSRYALRARPLRARCHRNGGNRQIVDRLLCVAGASLIGVALGEHSSVDGTLIEGLASMKSANLPAMEGA
jgi:hypothetical protein